MFFNPQGACDPAAVAVTSALVMGSAGIPGLFLRKRGPGQIIAAVATILAALAGIPAAVSLLSSHSVSTYILAWHLPFGACELAIDPLSAFFLIPIFLVSAAGSLFAIGYWPAAEHASTEPGLTFFYGLLASSMAILVMARNDVLFLIAWEVMALSAYFLLVTEHEREDVRRAGSIYLIATHTGSAVLLIFFSLLAAQTGSFLLPAGGSLSALPPIATVMALAAFIGFGAKAGIMPLHIWLPSAHANAPSHVSALMSGVMLKMGMYGIFRTMTFFSAPPLAWGVFLSIAGIASALLGIAFAMGQTDLKRLLACSSIENIGIITTGFGVTLLGISSHTETLTYLGMAGTLLHILNHSFFKPLLFLGSGVIIHASGTREINLMGGLAKAMPRAAFVFLTGSLAIAGIPPLNGFVSEFLLYLGFFSQLQTTGVLISAVMLAPLLALVGGLAVVTFMKLYGAVFLGVPRHRDSDHVHEPGWQMLFPMVLFALACAAIGLLPQFALRLISPAIATVLPDSVVGEKTAEYARLLSTLSRMSLLLIAVGAGVALIWRWRMRHSTVASGPTWGCGYLRGTARMQYVGTSFSELTVSVFNGLIRQKIERPVLTGIFPAPSRCLDRPTETILDRIISPLFTLGGLSSAFLRRLQHGQMHLYMLYILITLVILMLWAH